MAGVSRLERKAWQVLQLLLLVGCQSLQGGATPASLPKGARYVAMGSSYAAGPGVSNPADTPENRCSRSNDNYAHQFARRHALQLIDVSCSGATTAHVLGPWQALPPQVDAVTADTRLVTVTIGGNDVGYMGTLFSAVCDSLPTPPARVQNGKCPPTQVVTEEDWSKLAIAMDAIADEVRRRAPRAQLVFVQYPLVLPEQSLCGGVPASDAGAAAGRAVAGRLAQVTAQSAARKGAMLLETNLISRGHDACSQEPWTSGYFGPNGQAVAVPFHPNLAGMTAIAAALETVR